MAKLYLFAIGGTGARVLKAFTMLAAAGLKLPNRFTDIVPILIEPDSSNGDSRLTAEVINKYQKIRAKIHEPKHFFNIKINTLEQVSNPEASLQTDNVFMNLEGYSSDDRFRDFINYHELDATDKALIDLLFTEADLDLKMEVGFKGNPNIGSIVLDQFRNTDLFTKFAMNYGRDDSVFIISSIFGGTGAAGFPLLLKNLRSNDIGLPNHALIANSKIGAISYLPYYKIGLPPDGERKNIDSGTFFGRAKAALNYYDRAIFRNNSLDSFYFLGTDSTAVIPYAEGKSKQQNPAHFLEYAGALSIAHFAENQEHLDRNGNMKYFEYGIDRETEKIELEHLGINERETIAKRLASFTLFAKFLNMDDKRVQTKNDRWQRKGGYGKEYFGEIFYSGLLAPFLEHYETWITEMSKNSPAFDPFFESSKYDTLINFIRNQEIQNKRFSRKAAAGKIITALDRRIKNKHEEKDGHFVRMMDEVTEEIINGILK